jgi:Ribonuclease G/E
MATQTTRYTATVPINFMNELKKLADANKIPSVNSAINEALELYLKNLKESQYDKLMAEAAQDKAFLKRTMTCADDFKAVDGEVTGEW